MEALKARRRKLIRDVIIIALSFIIAIYLHQNNNLENLIISASGKYFLLSVFVCGILFASTFTVAISTSMLLLLAETHNPFLLASIGVFGAVVGDSLVFRFLRDDLIADFDYLENQIKGGKKVARQIFHSKLTLWLAPIIAAIMIASPLPDEFGLLLLAGLKLKYKQFIFISLFFNFIGMLVISFFAKTF